MTKVAIREVLPRDGFQDLEYQLPTKTKIEITKQLHGAGLRWIEVSSMVSPKWVPQFSDAEEVCRAAAGLAGLRRSVFIPNRRGLERAQAVGVEEISLAVASTDSLSRENFAMSVDEALSEVLSTARDAAADGLDVTVTIGGAFGCPFEGEVKPERVLGLAEQIADAGFGAIFLADTIGVGEARQIGALIAALIDRIPQVAAGIHLHGGLAATDGVLAAAEAGAAAIDSSLGGAGGCPFVPDAPGNVPTEAVVEHLNRAGFETDLEPGALHRLAAEINRRIEEESHAGTQ